MKKVVITGATGMIGRALVNYLLNKNIMVLAIVRENSREKFNITSNKNFKIIQCNLENLSNLKTDENNYDTFFHFAWDGTFAGARNNEELQSNNVKYSLSAIQLARKLGCKTFIGAGSQAEYGRTIGIIDEKTKTNPENFYAKGKLQACEVTKKFANENNIKHIWTRIFSVYGPYDKEKTMVMNSIITMIKEKKSPDYTKGEQMWDYIYSEDVAKAFYLLGEKGKNNSIYCIAQGEARPLHEYIKIIRDNINKDIELNLGKIPYADKQVMNLQANISKLKKDTGFMPEYTFEKGIIHTINWFKKKEGKNEKN